MHELGIVLEIFEIAQEISQEQNLNKIESITVEVGELCGIIPDYFKECWNVARLETPFENTKLELLIKPAVALCACGKEFELNKNGRVCPYCDKTDYKIISGRDFIIKQFEVT